MRSWISTLFILASLMAVSACTHSETPPPLTESGVSASDDRFLPITNDTDDDLPMRSTETPLPKTR